MCTPAGSVAKETPFEVLLRVRTGGTADLQIDCKGAVVVMANPSPTAVVSFGKNEPGPAGAVSVDDAVVIVE